MPATEAFRCEDREVKGIALKITSYQVGDEFFCQVANANPGGNICRARGATREEAVENALAEATAQLK